MYIHTQLYFLRPSLNILLQYFLLYSILGLGPRHYTVHLRAVLLLQFMEHLDKLMYNAYEGSCVTLPPVPKVHIYMYIINA